MDIFTLFTNLILNQASPLVAGLLAAFTPCTIAVFPIILYRFGIWNSKDGNVKTKAFNLVLLVATFIISFTAAGLFFQQLFNSQFINIVRLVLGTALVVLTVITWQGGSLSSLFGQITHPVLLGLSLPWLISFSPCVLPWLAFVTINTSTAATSFVLFSLGLISMPVLLAVLGNVGIRVVKRVQKLTLVLEKLSLGLLLISGIYISGQLFNFTVADATAAATILALGLLLTIVIIWRNQKLQTTYNLQMWLICSLWLLAVYVIAYRTALPATAMLSHNQLAAVCLPGEDSAGVQFSFTGLLFNSVGLLWGLWIVSRYRISTSIKWRW
jgi:cytochrome c biogenesis protein CcdA